MSEQTEIRKIAFVADYLPRKCGIATFTGDLRGSIAGAFPSTDCSVIAVNDGGGRYAYAPEVRFEIPEQELDSYQQAADFVNFSNADIVCLQHEFGIYGGPAGAHILALLRDLRTPVVTTLHTILVQPSVEQRRVMKQLTELSARLVVMSQRGREMLLEIYGVPEAKIDVIPHGIPDMPFVDPNFYKDQFEVEGRNVLLTFGLLSPSKGIEHALQALPQILERFPNTVYIVLGATHPNLLREQGESYRLSLTRTARELGVQQNVIFYNRFVELSRLLEFIGASDIYITPYLNPAQVTSGTLAYAFGCGKAVVSTPYWHAEELLADERGVLVPFGNSAALADAVRELLADEQRRHAMRKRAYLLGREMVWSNVAAKYMESFQLARRRFNETGRRAGVIRTLDQRPLELPRLKLNHLLNMTDTSGIFQHAICTIPNFREGYCTDDNARALILSVLLEELGQDSPEVARVAATYAGFLAHAFDAETARFRNFMGFDRRWLEVSANASDDSIGRSVWALGTCVGRAKQRGLQTWAMQLFQRGLAALPQVTSPRAWAFALIGIHEYLRRLGGDRLANQIGEELSGKLMELYRANADDDWLWFEDVVSYANAALPHALMLGGRASGNEEMLDVGLRTLRWLSRVQRSPKGCFRPVGCHGFYVRGQSPATFDQQPIEAHCTLSACIAAYQATDDDFWLNEARLSFDWFLGRNDLGVPLYDSSTGGCCDGLQEDRVNQNQGAESTISFLLSLAEMQLLQANLAAFDLARQPARVAESATQPARAVVKAK